MARSRLTSSLSRPRPTKLVRARGRLLSRRTPAKAEGASSSERPAASEPEWFGKLPAQISCCKRVASASGSVPKLPERASLSRSYWPRASLLLPESA
jgi:hypothetical protein